MDFHSGMNVTFLVPLFTDRYIDEGSWWRKLAVMNNIAKEPLAALRTTDSKSPHLHKTVRLFETVEKAVSAEAATGVSKGILTREESELINKYLTDVKPECVSKLALAADAVDPINIYSMPPKRPSDEAIRYVKDWVIVGFYDQKAFPDESIANLQSKIENAQRVFSAFLERDGEDFNRDKVIKDALNMDSASFYRDYGYLLGDFGLVGCMLVSQLSGNGESERANIITGNTLTKVCICSCICLIFFRFVCCLMCYDCIDV